MCFGGGGGGESKPKVVAGPYADNFGEAIPSNLDEQRAQTELGSAPQGMALGSNLGVGSASPQTSTTSPNMARAHHT